MTLRSGNVGTLCTRAEYDALLALFQEDLPIESRGRVRNMTLLAVNHAVTAAKALGRGPRSIQFLQSLSVPMPRLWELQAEAEENREDLVEDLVLNDELAEEEELEAPLHAELLHSAARKASG